MAVHGIFNVAKPAGPTSFAVVAAVRRLTGERRVGHAGTLDPAASGVLPICVGQATRLLEYLLDADKSYRATILLGQVTDTDDVTGQVIASADPSGVTRAQVEAALERFRGPITQIPPAYSALKQGGRKLYELARAGVTAERVARAVTIDDLQLVEWQPPSLVVTVVCSKGTYIRSLARDLGDALGCGATLAGLIRLRTGEFRLEQAVSLATLEAACRDGSWPNYLLPADTIVRHWPVLIVDQGGETLLRQGRWVAARPRREIPPEQPVRAYSPGGQLVAMVRLEPGARVWQPEKVFAENTI